MFDSTKQSLKTLLEQVRDGRIQLPEFQRDYVWTEEAIVSLIASISKGYPVGALLILERGGEVDFKPRGVEGTTLGGVEPDLLLLDGQQRMTSLFQSLFATLPARVRDAKGNVNARLFYMDMRKALISDADFEDAIVVAGSDRKVWKPFGRETERNFSTKELEFEQFMFPLNKMFDSSDWLYAFQDYWKDKDTDVYQVRKDFDQKIVEKITRYEMPIIKLSKANGRHAVCTIFEKVNVGGVKLDAFELLTAIFAGTDEGFDLRADWRGTKDAAGRLTRMQKNTPEWGVFSKIASTDFLQACTVLHTMERKAQREKEGLTSQVSCKRDELLALPLAAYKKHADRLEAGFREAAQFLTRQNILFGYDLPYPSQLTILACVFAVLGEKAHNASVQAKLDTWFWRGVIGEVYGSAVESKIARDVPEIIDWAMDLKENAPQSSEEANFSIDRLYYMRRRQSAAYKGFHALLMRQGCEDFVSGKPFSIMTLWQSNVDVHHIFPQAWCKDQQKDRGRMDSIINKTPLSDVTNRYIVRGDAPSVYLRRIEQEHNIAPEALDAILRTHLIDPGLMRADDFEGFYEDRRAKLAALAGKAMSKLVAADLEVPENAAVDDDEVVVEERVLEPAQ
ncbi:DUF262 domain-containing protein [Rhizobium redzepovicii]|uniref:DUF262 domain-containing protein n=1 Tax=Rhizobium redzepovicii TaxID=2867518 RepID=A0AAW8P099_9HYPH|nr:DUF262 domain-containing protein [Rhizobium redzepovicii]MDR9759419.1 DUF262 domain-containing protein [Rhizobium redzepovicii]